MVLTFTDELKLIRITFKKHLGLTTWIHIDPATNSPEIWIYKYNSDKHEWYYAGNLTYFKNLGVYDCSIFAAYIRSLIGSPYDILAMFNLPEEITNNNPNTISEQSHLLDIDLTTDDKCVLHKDNMRDVFMSSRPNNDDDLLLMNTLDTASYLHYSSYPSWFVDEVCRRQLTYRTIRGLLNVVDMIKHIILVDRNENNELLERACRIALRYKHKPKSKPFWNMVMNSNYVKIALTTTFGQNTTVKQRKMLTRNAVEMLIAADHRLSIGDCFKKLNTRSCVENDNDENNLKFEIIYSLCNVLDAKFAAK